MTDTKNVYQFGRYAVQKVSGEEYGVFNTETDVKEFKTSLLFNAVQAAQRFEIEMKELEAKTPAQIGKEMSWPEAVEASAPDVA